MTHTPADPANTRRTCSHDFRDARFIGGFTSNWNVSPVIDPRPEMNDGSPRRTMQYGQRYVCNRCGEGVEPRRPSPRPRVTPEMYAE